MVYLPCSSHQSQVLERARQVFRHGENQAQQHWNSKHPYAVVIVADSVLISTDFKKEQMIECLCDPKSWIFVIMSESKAGLQQRIKADETVFCISFLSGGINTFGRKFT